MKRYPLLIPLVTLSCGAPGVPDPELDSGPSAPVARAQDILTTHLSLDLEGLTGAAELEVLPASDEGFVTLDVAGLDLTEVSVDGQVVSPTRAGDQVLVPVPDVDAPVTIAISYGFGASTLYEFAGWMPSQGVSFVWPSNCGQLFPCDPSPADGVTFTMDVTGAGSDLTVVYPTTTFSEAPSYMPAIAVGDYTQLDLGITGSGTQVWAWYGGGEAGLERALAGTEHLVAAIDYFETRYGAYAFGPETGTVSVDWGPDSYGGMEHHPFFHVGRFDFSDEEAQIHEAAHGWYGDGVRLECWEDFVLSEGTTTYITAHAMDELGGPDFWDYYVEDFLVPICRGLDYNAVVLPDETCNEIDFEQSNLWSLAPYMKGACFYEDVADLIGQDAVDEAIGEFYVDKVNEAARMGEMIDRLKSKADPGDADEIDALVDEWLRTYECPADYAERCREHLPR